MSGMVTGSLGIFMVSDFANFGIEARKIRGDLRFPSDLFSLSVIMLA